jgi:hypothetical protein
MTTVNTVWSDVEQAAKEMAGNWRRFDCFAWHRSWKIEDTGNWAIIYTSNRDSGLLDRSNEAEITKRLEPYMEGDDPDVVAERHSHWAVGHLDGFAIRVYRPDGTITPAFVEFCDIKERLENYPILNEEGYSQMEYEAALANYRSELGRLGDQLPVGWESEVFGWFENQSLNRYTENRDDQGAWAPKDQIVAALTDLGLMPAAVVG